MNLGPYQPNSYNVGDCRALMCALPADSIDCCVTSPPYWGLRDYGIAPSVWGGRPSCEHHWGRALTLHKGGPHGAGVMLEGGRSVVGAQAATKDIAAGQFCHDCGAWLGGLGLEPTHLLYVEHMVEVFREVRRVLKPAGTCWLNIGDCYATGAGAVGDCPGGGAQGERWRGARGERLGNGRGDQCPERRTKNVGPMTQPNRLPQPGLKPKDLVMIPHRVAIALQADGWWVRMDVVWEKRTAMPESVTDRPTKAHEFVFLLTKAEQYFYDADAIAETTVGRTLHDVTGPGQVAPGQTPQNGNRRKSVNKELHYPSGNGERPADHLASGVPWEGVAGKRNKRSVWSIAGEPTKDAHFATMPTKLAQPCILAGCPVGGIVLDPFGGSGTVGRVAEDNGRQWLLFDMSPEYSKIAKRRTAQTGMRM
jgi:DNA modification methylase